MSKDTVLSLLPVIVHIEVVQGTDAKIEFQLTDGNGVGSNISGDEVQFTARDTFNGTVKIALSNNAAQHSDPVTGKTIFVLPKAQLVTEDPSSETSWVYEVRRIFATTAYELVYFEGELRLKATVGAQP
jgi:hypothetical protein